LAAVRYVQKLSGTKALAPFVSERVDYPTNQHPHDSDDYWKHVIRQFAFTAGHPSGTCAIGKVVDTDLRVLGVEGLRVVDNSVFPTTVSGDSTGVLYGVAEKISDIIRKENS